MLDGANLFRALKRIGIGDESVFWDGVGEDEGLKAIFNTKKPRETGKAAQAFLTDFVKKRNNMVHKGDAIEPVT